MRPTVGVLGLSGQSVMLRIDHFHQRGETVAAESLFTEPGGKGYNQAVAAARLGARVRYLSCIGDDEDGAACVARMRAEGVEARWARSPRHTALATILTDASGENQVTVYRGAADDLSADHVLAQEGWLAECDGLLLQLECPAEAIGAALDIARRRHIPVFMNPAPARPLPLEWLRAFAWLMPNEQEACQLFQLSAFDSIQVRDALRRMGVPKVLVTLGAEGVVLIAPEGVRAWPAQPVRPVDTTGAGDTFCAAFACKTLEGEPPETAIPFAVRAAAYSVARAHVLDGMPTAGALEAR